MNVYVVTATTGEYSDTTWWVVGVFRDRMFAEAHVAELDAEWKRVGSLFFGSWRAVGGWEQGGYDAKGFPVFTGRLADPEGRVIEHSLCALDARAKGCKVDSYGSFKAPTYEIDEVEEYVARDSVVYDVGMKR